MYQVGYTMEQIVKLTGHKNINMPSHYLHQLKERQKEVHLNMSELNNGKIMQYHLKEEL